MDLTALRNRTSNMSFSARVPPVRTSMNAGVMNVLECAALIPPVAVAAYERGSSWLLVLLVAVVTAVFWQRIFSEVRARSFTPDGVVIAAASAIALPTATPLWQVGLAVSFGVVVGQEIFGGRGRNFLNPASLVIVFLIFSFPGRALETMTPAIGVSVIPGALLLVACGLISWRVIVASIIALFATGYLSDAGQLPLDALPSAFIFGLIFFAADPVAAPSTNLGRWIYGVLVGGVTVSLAGGGVVTMEAIVSAALLAAVLAPLVDCGVIKLNAYQRGRGYG